MLVDVDEVLLVELELLEVRPSLLAAKEGPCIKTLQHGQFQKRLEGTHGQLYQGGT